MSIEQMKVDALPRGAWAGQELEACVTRITLRPNAPDVPTGEPQSTVTLHSIIWGAHEHDSECVQYPAKIELTLRHEDAVKLKIGQVFHFMHWRALERKQSA